MKPSPGLAQYEIWWANLPAPAGRRPVLLLSRDDAYEYLNKFLVAEVTTTVRNIAMEVSLGPAEGLQKRCVANPCETNRTARPVRHDEVKRAVGYACLLYTSPSPRDA